MAKSKRHTSGATVDPDSRKTVNYAPRNMKQRDYLRSIQTNDITFGIGSAGSGKTYLAAMAAIECFERGLVERIIISRPAVTAGNERHGYIPGDLNDKLDPYMRPVIEAFSEYWSQKTISIYRAEKRIDVLPFAFMRGMTFKNAFVLADEAQNTTLEQMFMLLTRLGEGSKMVLTGDPDQSDIPSRTLEVTKQRLSGLDRVGWVEFDPADVIRHPTVESIIRVWNPNLVVKLKAA